jgi:hypothetical protein
MRSLLALFLLVLSFSPVAFAQSNNGATQEQPPTIKLPDEFAKVLADYEKFYLAKDAAGVAGLFAKENSYEMINNRPPIVGRDAIEAFYKPSGGQNLHLRPFAYGKSGDVGFIVGGYGTQESGPDDNKFTMTLKRISGKWTVISAMGNSNKPRPPAPSPASSAH